MELTRSEVAKVLEYHSVFDYRVAITTTTNRHAFFRGKRINSIYEYAEAEGTVSVAAMLEKHKKDVMATLNICGFGDVIWVSLESENAG